MPLTALVLIMTDQRSATSIVKHDTVTILIQCGYVQHVRRREKQEKNGAWSKYPVIIIRNYNTHSYYPLAKPKEGHSVITVLSDWLV
jgi:hypothetical protein